MTVDLDVVIPVRTVDRYLGEAIASVLEQRGVDVSVVVVDGGSEPPIELPSTFVDDPRVRLIRSSEPLLAGGGRTLGATVGTREWLGFLDADDRWAPGAMQALIHAATSADADLAFGSMTHFRSDEESRRLHVPEGRRPAKIAGGCVVRRTLWQRVGPFDPELRTGEFIDWFLRARSAGAAIAEIDDLVLERRVHIHSSSAQLIGDRDDYLEVVRRWMKKID